MPRQKQRAEKKKDLKKICILVSRELRKEPKTVPELQKLFKLSRASAYSVIKTLTEVKEIKGLGKEGKSPYAHVDYNKKEAETKERINEWIKSGARFKGVNGIHQIFYIDEDIKRQCLTELGLNPDLPEHVKWFNEADEVQKIIERGETMRKYAGQLASQYGY